MSDSERERLIRQYAAGEITWRTLRQRGFDNYLDVLAALGALGLLPPVAPMEGPNVETRTRARAVIREALRAAADEPSPNFPCDRPGRSP